uniref:Ubiquitin-like modifier-activating enzyme ATG7 n=2 Tax=Aplanochytrium stocchinoi TaxID=215587 RepID=A0A7S3PHV4_9STRA|mmetsp:Transcript_20318/g.24659  ORF Transcript_20318/g.24659 Transcript_20318/m.24659 type:complete len:393 (+) Transcript_20318:302-1480(+)
MVENISDNAKTTFVGWEPNANGKMGPRVIDLSAHLDPIRLAEAACNLNLKLMTWRALPELNLNLLATTKCLLLGSGTLGCAVARGLLGWGFRNITMLDNGKVSYSNPVRQSLFAFDDCKNGGKPKAEAAVESLKAIFPGVNAKAISLTIPMPGHFVTSDAEHVEHTVKMLEELIQQHDAIFLLTDTRESRWLPTVFCAMYDKILINAALGFDGYLVMRHGHGLNVSPTTETESQQRLGCYFCNDIVAPRNSTQDRTLDQQCTVTRPGLAPVAGALAVEMLVNLLHNELGNRAPCPSTNDCASTEKSKVSKLGILPHQIRGFFSTFSSVLVQGPAFNQCTACSSRIIDKVRDEGFPTLLRIFNDPDYLESLAGLDELKTDTDLCDFDEDWTED